MYGSKDEHLLSTCFQELTGIHPSSLARLRPHASERRRYRVRGGGYSYIGVVNGSVVENETFICFARHFASLDLAVPTVYLYRPDSCAYLEQDLGDTTLLDLLHQGRLDSNEQFPETARALHVAALQQLSRFQIDSVRTPSFAQRVAGSNLTLHTLRPDLYLFMTELVERVLPDFDCAQMASDFDALIDFLADAETNFFMYRDFQARNIMIVDGAPYFIDFQGGCRGPLQYDVVSLLYQTSARIPQTERDNLLQSYLEAARQIHPLNVDVFTRFISAFVVYRMLQVLGVYGKQGLGAGKEYFSSSIPGALRTLIYELQRKDFPLSLAKLLACGERLLNAFTND